MNRSVAIFALTVAGCVAVWPQVAHACAVCYGDPASSQTAALNMAIFTMLGVTGCVLSSIAGMGFILWRRAVQAADGENGGQHD